MTRRTLLPLLFAAPASAYPLDAFARTGIRRLEAYRAGLGGRIPPGGMLNSADVRLRLQTAAPNFDLTPTTPKDPALQRGLDSIFAPRDPSYNIALLDISNPAQPLYAAVKPDEKRIPGSVGKILVATGIFGGLARAYPNDIAARERVLRETIVSASPFVHRDGKTVPYFTPGQTAVINRRIEIGDKFNLWEWLDHMLSQSSNAAAAETWKQAMILHQFGPKYPVSQAESDAFFRDTPKKPLG